MGESGIGVDFDPTIFVLFPVASLAGILVLVVDGKRPLVAEFDHLVAMDMLGNRVSGSDLEMGFINFCTIFFLVIFIDDCLSDDSRILQTLPFCLFVDFGRNWSLKILL